jgi:hypothetical protein
MNRFRFSCAVDDLALFVSDGWHSLPPQVWVAICKLTGAKPPQRARTAGSIKTVDMQHLLEAYPKESQIIHWVFAKLEEFPHVKTGDMLASMGIVLKHYTSKAITNALVDHHVAILIQPSQSRFRTFMPYRPATIYPRDSRSSRRHTIMKSTISMRFRPSIWRSCTVTSQLLSVDLFRR